MEYQGDNQFTKVVKALKFVQEQFDRVLLEMEKIGCGFTKAGVGNLIVEGLAAPTPSMKRSLAKRGTIIEALGDKLNVQVKKSSHYKNSRD